MISVTLAKRGYISTIPGVVRNCDRQEFVLRTNNGERSIRPGDVVIRLGRRVMVWQISAEPRNN